MTPATTLIPARVGARAELLSAMISDGQHPFLEPEALRALACTHLHDLLTAYPPLVRHFEVPDGPRVPLPTLSGAPYSVICADPPWRFGDTLGMSTVKRGADAVYRATMADNAIVRLPISSLAADNAVLVLWYPPAMPELACAVMRAWGFEPKQTWIWVKTTSRQHEPIDNSTARLLRLLFRVTPSRLTIERTRNMRSEIDAFLEELRRPKLAFGMGRLARGAMEPMLVGTRGSPYAALQDRSTRNVFLAPNRGHSIKPPEIQDALERMFPEGHRLELFARRQRPGWDCVGNEAPATLGEDVVDAIPRLGHAVPAGDQIALFSSSP